MSAFLFRVCVRGLCFGFDVEDGAVTDAAPVAKWMVGKRAAWAAEYWRRRGAQVLWMKWPDGPWNEVG